MNICPPQKNKTWPAKQPVPRHPHIREPQGTPAKYKDVCSFALCLLFLPSDPPSFSNLREKRKDEKRETRDHTLSPTEDLRLGLS